MANSVPTLTNENFHMFEPSPLETSLAARVGDPANPQMFPLMMSARARGEQAAGAYQSQIDQMHATQVAEAMMAQRTARMTAAGGLMKSAGETPGMVQALISGGMIDPNTDLSGIDAGANAKATATNLGTGGRGLGAMAMGGFTGLAPAAQSVAGPGVDQGPSALEKAAMIKESGASSRHASGAGGSKITGRLGDDGELTFSGKMLPGETPDQFRTRVGGGAPPPTFAQRAAAQRASGGGRGGMTSLPVAQQDTPPVSAPVQQMAAPAQSTDTAKAQVAAAVQKMLPRIQQQNPAAYADIHAAGAINPVPYRGSWAVQGASGKTYPLGGAQ